MTRFVGRAGRYALPIAAAALLLAACGGKDDGITIGAPSASAPTSIATTAAPTTAPDSTSPRSAPTTPEQSTPSTDRCHTSEVSLAFGPEDAAAGSRMGTVILTNTSKRTCTVFGYGGLQVQDAQGKALSIALTRDATPAPVLLRLAPGAKAYKDFRFGAVPSGTGACPTPASAAITPPDETDNHVVTWPYGPVCDDIQGRAYQHTSVVAS
ncbi:MAG TPA: DUF4232 domain-containing protein [Mycobacteriales bacterium]|nr:DUF4232 domain-containing protein [Mycobacteriales bacterium]